MLFLTYGYFFLLDQSLYMNHYYLIALLSWILAILPAHRAVSVDARLWPALRGSTAPAWAVWLLRFSIALP